MVHRCSLNSIFVFDFPEEMLRAPLHLFDWPFSRYQAASHEQEGCCFLISARDLLCAFSTVATVILLLQQCNKQEVQIDYATPLDCV